MLLKDKIAFVAGIGDDSGYGWAIAKILFANGARVISGTWPPIFQIFKQQWNLGKFDESRRLPDGRLLEFEDMIPLDASFDTEAEVPEEVKAGKRIVGLPPFSIEAVANYLKEKVGHVDILVHSLANAPEITKPLLETSRQGYLAAQSASSYSLVSLLRHLGPLMPKGSSCLTLTYLAGARTVPGYGGGMSSAKASLENDVRTLAWEAGRKWGIRVNALSPGPLKSRAARAIGKSDDRTFIEKMIDYSHENAPLQKPLLAEEVGKASLFLASDGASAITGVTLYVDNGLHTMGIAPDSKSL